MSSPDVGEQPPGVILVDHDDHGEVRVTHTADHLGRRGMTWGGSVGVLVGLLSPPLLASVVVGGAVGGVVGKFTRTKVDSGLEEALADKLPSGGAMIIAIVDEEDRLEVDVEIPEGGAEGVLVANADFIGGFSLWLDGDGLLNHSSSFLGVGHLPAGVRPAGPHRPHDAEDALRVRRTQARVRREGHPVGRRDQDRVGCDGADDLAPMSVDDARALHEHGHHHSIGQSVAG